MSDEKYMKIAIKEAKKGVFPFGAVVVKNNEIIAKAHNEVKLDPTAHAEINAIRKACKKLNSRHLDDCTLYSSCEPCAMCFTAAWWARIPRIVYGALANDVTKDEWKIDVDCKYLNEKSGNKIEIKEGILREESLKLFKD